MSLDVLHYRIEQAERLIVQADAYEEKNEPRFARQSARHAAGWYQSAAREAITTNHPHLARKLLTLAESAYRRGRSPVYVRKMQERLSELEKEPSHAR